MDRAKISVIGAGAVGATVAHLLVLKKLADVVLVDVIEGLPQGKALDILEAGPIEGSPCRVTGTNGYEGTAGSDLVVISAGLPRKPGMSRDDLLFTNHQIVGAVVDQATRLSPRAVLIVVTNPLDVMTHLALQRSGFPKQRVLGMAGALDAARFRTFVAQELRVCADDVTALVLGGHGDTMVPLPRHSSVAGIPLTELLTSEQIEALVRRTREGGAEIVSLLKTGSAYYAPASAVVAMIEAILEDARKIFPCCAYLEGEYDIHGVCLGVPVKLGRGGIEEIVRLPLAPAEAEALQRSAAVVREMADKLGLRAAQAGRQLVRTA